MPRNKKLTKVIAGRTIKATTTEAGSILVLFDDESSMKIKTTGAAAVSPGNKVKSVHEAKADFKIEFEDGSSATFCLADPGSSVVVRDKNNAVEYSGINPRTASTGLMCAMQGRSERRSLVQPRFIP
jgi:hypothetical protein